MNFKRSFLLFFTLMVCALEMAAQQKISGRVIDEDGFAVPYASVQYKDTRLPFQVMERVSLPSRSIPNGCLP